jgi:hypothetical protein
MRFATSGLALAMLVLSCKHRDPRAVCADGGGKFFSVAHYDSCCYPRKPAECPSELPNLGEDGCCHNREWQG